jgi:hypothetical protein
VDESQTIEIKREKFIKSLFLCLFLLTYLSVDRFTQPFIYVVYSDSKVCGHVPMRPLDKCSKPVDERGGYPQSGFYSGFRPCYQLGTEAVIHRA